MDCTQSDFEQHPIVLFDGLCTLCTGAVVFIIKRDSHARFRFAALQSDPGKRLMEKYKIDRLSAPSISLLTGPDQSLSQSDAVLAIARHLDGHWRMLYWARVVPRTLRDWCYQQVARHRYKIFGRREACMPLTPEIEQRFIGEV